MSTCISREAAQAGPWGAGHGVRIERTVRATDTTEAYDLAVAETENAIPSARIDGGFVTRIA